MPCPNPTGDGPAVVLHVPAGNLPPLRVIFLAGREGAREDLDKFGGKLPRPDRRLREEAMYGRMLDAIEGAPLYPDDELVAFIAKLAEAIDHDNDYERVASEHDALRGLLAQLEGPVA